MPDLDEQEELRIAEADIRRINVQIAYEHDRLDVGSHSWRSETLVRELRLCVLSRMLEQALNVRSENLRRRQSLV